MLAILMVDADAAPGGLGQAWDSAYNDLQDALTQAAALNANADGTDDIEAVWIAEGAYKPSALLETGNARSASFSLLDGVTLYGGFAGIETTLSARDWSTHVTTLSGDLGVSGDNSDNAYTVVFGDATVEAGMDGVSIIEGNADGVYDASHPEGSSGGGLCSGGTVTVANSTLSGNSTQYDGGGIHNGGTLTVTNSTLSGNSVGYGEGGGIYSYSTLTVTNSTITDNSARYDGGGICSEGALTVTNSTISGNSAQNEGGGICDWGFYSLLDNTIVAGNAADFGPNISTFGGTLFGSHNLIGDGSDQFDLFDGIDGNQIGDSSSPIDPLLSNWTQFDNGQWGYRLLPGSPALDAGDNALALDPAGQPLTEDGSGNARIQNGTVDIGAVEGALTGTPARTYTVTSLETTIASDGVLTFTEAFEAANRNQPVGDAAAGSVTEQDRIQFAAGLSGTVALDGGELAIVGDLSIEGPGAELLTFDAGGQNRVFLVQPGVSANLGGMTVTGGSASFGGGVLNLGILTVIGSTIFGNSAIENWSGGGEGGAIGNEGALTVTNSTISGNSASYYGGGISNYGTLTVTSSTLSGNSAQFEGGGICQWGSSAILNNALVAGNTAGYGQDISAASGTLFGSHNLVGDGSGQSDLLDGVDGNQIGTSSAPIDPLLSNWTQSDNGQWGHYLLPGSPALDAGDNALALDAAGQPLTEDVFGNTRIQNGTVDMGAVEGATAGTSARTYTVTSLAGTIADDGILTFIEAFEAANRNQPVGNAAAGSFIEQDLIQFADGLSGTVALGGGELAIFGDLEIAGPGADLLIFDAASQSRVFLVLSGASARLGGIGVTGGLAAVGGGISNHGTLVVTDSTVAGNRAISDSSGGGEGGGVYNGGELTLARSTLAGNSAGSGGGIFNDGTLSVNRSVFSTNIAQHDGGGIFNYRTLTVTNSLLLGNFTWGENGAGGGILNGDTLTVTNSTILGNSAQFEGGGICECGFSSILNNVIVAGNAAQSGPDVRGEDDTLSGSHNLISDGSGQTDLVDGVDGNQIGTASVPVDPLLNADFRLTAGSSAIDAGNNANVPPGVTTDLDGNPRFVDGDVDGTVTVDIGAFEFAELLPGVRIIEGDGSTNVSEDGATDTYDVVLMSPPDAEVTITMTPDVQATVTPDQLTFTPDGGAYPWDQPQTVTVAAVDDGVDEDTPHTGTIVHSVASTDSKYNGFIVDDVTVQIADKLTAGITVDPASGLKTTEAGGTATFTVVLDLAPVADVTIGLSSSDTTEGTVFPTSLLFTPQDWNVQQEVTVTGVGDGDDDGNIDYFIMTAPAASDDTDYSGLDAEDVLVKNLEDSGTLINMSLVRQVTAFDNDDTGEVSTLPSNEEWIDEWTSFYIEIWVSTPDADDIGVVSSQIDLTYNTDYFTATDIEYGPGFDHPWIGIIDDAAGVVDDLGAETLATDVGDDRYALLARVRFEPTVDDSGVPLGADGKYITPVDHGFALDHAEVILIGPIVAAVEIGDSPDTELWPVMYDIDNDGRVGFGDFAFFATAFQQTVGDPGATYAWAADFDHSGRVGFGDFAFFATNFQRTNTSGIPLDYHQDFPEAWQPSPLILEAPLTPPQGAATLVTDQKMSPLVAEALQRLETSQGSAARAILENVTVEIVDLPGARLGQSSGNHVWIDADAAGYGWFIDTTPWDDLEFSRHTSTDALIAPLDSAARHRVDLLTTLMHEFGHVLDYEHTDDHGVMHATLPLSTRRVLSEDWLFSSLASEEEDGDDFWEDELLNTEALDEVFSQMGA